jgi:hypothetical protein
MWLGMVRGVKDASVHGKSEELSSREKVATAADRNPPSHPSATPPWPLYVFFAACHTLY